MEDAARQLLRAFRGKRSQLAFSRRQGFRGNAVASWEAGRRFPTARLALRAALLAGCDVEQAFRQFEPSCVPTGFERAQIADWLHRLRGAESTPVLASRTGLSRHALGRILRGDAEPKLPDFLRIVEAATGRVSDLVAAMVDINSVPALAPEHLLKARARELAFDEPWSVPVLRLLETAAYQRQPHRPGYLSEVLGIDHATEVRSLAGLVEADIIRWDGSRYRPHRELTVNARPSPQSLSNLKRHWAATSLEFVGQPSPPNRFSYNVFSCSAADFERIREKHWQFYHEVRAIIAASTPAERVGLLTIHLVEWQPPEVA
jgi:transcriptional regulator with XRE-family HTH domain